jgi:hypothetical protein
MVRKARDFKKQALLASRLRLKEKAGPEGLTAFSTAGFKTNRIFEPVHI